MLGLLQSVGIQTWSKWFQMAGLTLHLLLLKTIWNTFAREKEKEFDFTMC